LTIRFSSSARTQTFMKRSGSAHAALFVVECFAASDSILK
jgi:hypothetical protein